MKPTHFRQFLFHGRCDTPTAVGVYVLQQLYCEQTATTGGGKSAQVVRRQAYVLVL